MISSNQELYLFNQPSSHQIINYWLTRWISACSSCFFRLIWLMMCPQIVGCVLIYGAVKASAINHQVNNNNNMSDVTCRSAGRQSTSGCRAALIWTHDEFPPCWPSGSVGSVPDEPGCWHSELHIYCKVTHRTNKSHVCTIKSIKCLFMERKGGFTEFVCVDCSQNKSWRTFIFGNSRTQPAVWACSVFKAPSWNKSCTSHEIPHEIPHESHVRFCSAAFKSSSRWRSVSVYEEWPSSKDIVRALIGFLMQNRCSSREFLFPFFHDLNSLQFLFTASEKQEEWVRRKESVWATRPHASWSHFPKHIIRF